MKGSSTLFCNPAWDGKYIRAVLNIFWYLAQEINLDPCTVVSRMSKSSSVTSVSALLQSERETHLLSEHNMV